MLTIINGLISCFQGIWVLNPVLELTTFKVQGQAPGIAPNAGIAPVTSKGEVDLALSLRVLVLDAKGGCPHQLF